MFWKRFKNKQKDNIDQNEFGFVYAGPSFNGDSEADDRQFECVYAGPSFYENYSITVEGQPPLTLNHDLKTITIGRDPSCGIVVENAHISRHHVTLIGTYGGWEIRDDHSANGTLLNGERLSPNVSYPLKDGDIVTLAGCVRLLFKQETDHYANFMKRMNSQPEPNNVYPHTYFADSAKDKWK